MNRPFATGDIVKLNSGSPAMAITEIDGDVITVFWVADDGTSQTGVFPRECLTPIMEFVDFTD